MVATSVAVGQLPQVADFRRAYRLSVWNAPRGLVQATSTAGGHDFFVAIYKVKMILR